MTDNIIIWNKAPVMLFNIVNDIYLYYVFNEFNY